MRVESWMNKIVFELLIHYFAIKVFLKLLIIVIDLKDLFKTDKLDRIGNRIIEYV